MDHLHQVCNKKVLYATPKKCAFFITQIHFLGFIVSNNRVYVDPEKVRAIEEWPELKTIHDVKSFHKLITFIDNLSKGLVLSWTRLPTV